MKAFVKTTEGNFPNHNFYSAWKGFTQLGYEVVKFEDSRLTDEDFWKICTRDTPVFAGVSIFDKVTRLLGAPYGKIDTYPNSLKPFLKREISKSTLGEFETLWNRTEVPKFIKPVKQKVFNGIAVKTLLNWFYIYGAPKDTEIYVSDIVEFQTEYRVYIRDGFPVGVKHYRGDPFIPLNKKVVEDTIDAFTEAPVCYALDFGVIKSGETVLIEFNDFTSLGNYGLDSLMYGSMIADRWFEITHANK
jgi:hypothetical protein